MFADILHRPFAKILAERDVNLVGGLHEVEHVLFARDAEAAC